MIEELTKEQQENIPIYVDKWYENQLSTEQYSDEEITDSVDEFYVSIGKSKPEKIIILNSPKQCSEYMIKNNIIIGNSVYKSIDNSIYNLIWNSIRDYVHNTVFDFISISFYNYSQNSIFRSVSETVKNSSRNVHCHSWCSKWSSIIDSIYYSNYYSIRIDYSINILDIKKLQQYKQYLNISEKAYYVALKDDIAIICRKLKRLHLDHNNRLHGDGIKAYEFNDSYGYYFNRGTLVPTKYGKVKIKNWKPQWLLTETNTELKRLLIREIGYDKIAKELNSTLIHKQNNMELLEINDVDIELMRLLKVICPSTNSTYLLRVPPNIDKCEECRQWTLFNENEEYDFVKES